MSDNPEITGVSIFVGFLVGLMMSGILLALSIGLGQWMLPRSNWIFPATNGALIIVSGLVALRYYRGFGIARGIVLALGVVFLLNGICGLTLTR